MSASNMMKKVFSRKSVKKDWAPISMLAKFVREKDVVSFEESRGEVLVQREKDTAVTKAEESQSAIMASEAVKGDVIEIQDFEENNLEKENLKQGVPEETSTKSESVIYLWMFCWDDDVMRFEMTRRYFWCWLLENIFTK